MPAQPGILQPPRRVARYLILSLLTAIAPVAFVLSVVCALCRGEAVAATPHAFYSDVVLSAEGRAVPGASVRVYQAGTKNKAKLFRKGTTKSAITYSEQPNPLVAGMARVNTVHARKDVGAVLKAGDRLVTEGKDSFRAKVAPDGVDRRAVLGRMQGEYNGFIMIIP